MPVSILGQLDHNLQGLDPVLYFFLELPKSMQWMKRKLCQSHTFILKPKSPINYGAYKEHYTITVVGPAEIGN